MNDINKLEKTLRDLPSEIPEEVTSWLARLVLLYGVPFNYLIPEEEMLPKESLRFFFLDPTWIQCLVQGACSVGSNGYGDTIIDKAMNEWVQPNQPVGKNQASVANKKAAGVRDRLRKQYEDVPLPPEDACLDWPLTGFLLRSAVVEGWRGLEVMAYRNLTDSEKQGLGKQFEGKANEIDTITKNITNKEEREKLRPNLRKLLREQKPEELQKLLRLAGVQTQEEFVKLLVELVKPLKPFRIEQLSKDVMLGIFNGIIAQLVIRQPQEGLHFGLTLDNQSFTKTLRELGYENPENTGEILQDNKIDMSNGDLMRDKSRGVINICALADEMKKQLSLKEQLKEGKFTSAEFAVEMIEAAGKFTFQPNDKNHHE